MRDVGEQAGAIDVEEAYDLELELRCFVDRGGACEQGQGRRGSEGSGRGDCIFAATPLPGYYLNAVFFKPG